MEKQPNIYLFTGDRDSGKTSFLKVIIERLTAKNIKIDGCYTEKRYDLNRWQGYDLVHIADGNKLKFLTLKTDVSDTKTSRFEIDETSLSIGNLWLNNIASSTDLIIIDEIGNWELQGKVWAATLQQLVKNPQQPLLLVVREKFLKNVIAHFKLDNYSIFNTDNFTKSDFYKDFF